MIANCVFVTISRSAVRGSIAVDPAPASGSVGKSSRGSVCIRDSNRSAATLTPLLSSEIRMSVSGRDLTISYSFFAGSVSDPPLSDRRSALAAQVPPRGRWQETCTSSPLASISTLARIGIVFLRSTMPWKSCSSRRRSFLRTTSSITVLTSKKAGVVPRSLEGRRDLRIGNYIGREGAVEKLTTPIIRYFPNIYLVEIMWSFERLRWEGQPTQLQAQPVTLNRVCSAQPCAKPSF